MHNVSVVSLSVPVCPVCAYLCQRASQNTNNNYVIDVRPLIPCCIKEGGGEEGRNPLPTKSNLISSTLNQVLDIGIKKIRKFHSNVVASLRRTLLSDA